jgi:hypothetical protein
MQKTATNTVVVLDGEQCLFIQQYKDMSVNIRVPQASHVRIHTSLNMSGIMWKTSTNILLKLDGQQCLFIQYNSVYKMQSQCTCYNNKNDKFVL